MTASASDLWNTADRAQFCRARMVKMPKANESERARLLSGMVKAPKGNISDRARLLAGGYRESAEGEYL